MAQFHGSTQEEFWMMDAATVSKRRKDAHSTAVAARDATARRSTLSLEEEMQIRQFHERRILRFVTQISFPEKVSATAITYFKRYFLTRSVMDYNPSVIALCALYSAFKVEEVLMSADDLVSRVDIILNGVAPDADVKDVPLSLDRTSSRVSSDILLKIELAFLQQINFHLICYHPLRSLGIVRERLAKCKYFSEIVSDKEPQGKTTDDESPLSKVINRASQVVMQRAMISDLPLSQPPAVITIAATLVAADEAGGPPEEDILAATLPGEQNAWGHVREAAAVMRAMGDRPAPGETERVAALEKRRRLVMDEENDPMTSKAFGEAQRAKLADEDEDEMELGLAFQEKMRKRKAELTGFTADADADGEDDGTDGVAEINGGGSARKRLKLVD